MEIQHLWIGGVTDRSLLSSLFTPVQAFKGCIQKVTITISMLTLITLLIIAMHCL